MVTALRLSDCRCENGDADRGGLALSQPDSSRSVIVLFAQGVCSLATTILKSRETMSYFVRNAAYVPPQCASNWQPFAPNFSLWGASEEF